MKDISELYDKIQAMEIPVEYLSFFEKVVLNMEYNKFKIIIDGILEFGFDPSCFDPKLQRLLRQYTPTKESEDIIDETLLELKNMNN